MTLQLFPQIYYNIFFYFLAETNSFFLFIFHLLLPPSLPPYLEAGSPPHPAAAPGGILTSGGLIKAEFVLCIAVNISCAARSRVDGGNERGAVSP